MACGGCKKRKDALIRKVDFAINEEEEAIVNKRELPERTKLFLKKNHSVVLMRKKDRLLREKKDIIRSGKDIPETLNKKIEEQNKQINDHFSIRKSKSENAGQDEIVQKIKQGKTFREIIPEELQGLVEIKEFDPFRNQPVLTAAISPHQKRAIMRNERMVRKNLISAINLKREEQIEELLKKYSGALFDLFLLIKRTEI